MHGRVYAYPGTPEMGSELPATRLAAASDARVAAFRDGGCVCCRSTPAPHASQSHRLHAQAVAKEFLIIRSGAPGAPGHRALRPGLPRAAAESTLTMFRLNSKRKREEELMCPIPQLATSTILGRGSGTKSKQFHLVFARSSQTG